MARTLKGLLRLKTVGIRRNKKLIRNTAVIGAAGGFGGAVAGGSVSPSGRRKAGRNEGAVTGAITAAAAVAGSTIVFRRIRGRIIPIRKKLKRLK